MTRHGSYIDVMDVMINKELQIRYTAVSMIHCPSYISKGVVITINCVRQRTTTRLEVDIVLEAEGLVHVRKKVMYLFL